MLFLQLLLQTMSFTNTQLFREHVLFSQTFLFLPSLSLQCTNVSCIVGKGRVFISDYFVSVLLSPQYNEPMQEHLSIMTYRKRTKYLTHSCFVLTRKVAQNLICLDKKTWTSFGSVNGKEVSRTFKTTILGCSRWIKPRLFSQLPRQPHDFGIRITEKFPVERKTSALLSNFCNRCVQV